MDHLKLANWPEARLGNPVSTPRPTGFPGRPRVCFLYVAQKHHVLHSLSVAQELACRWPQLAVEVAATDEAVLRYARSVMRKLGGAPVSWRLLGPSWLRVFRSRGVPWKVPMLAANRRALAGFDVVVTAELTSSMLADKRRAGPAFIYTHHGAGDSPIAFEPRLRRFDLVFAAGRKQRDRMAAEGLVPQEHCPIVGYPKFDLVDRLDAPRPALFRERRPVVLYNPHSEAALSSWPIWGRQVLAAFTRQSDYNLIFAPHLRLFGGRTPKQIPELADFIGRESIHMDTAGSSAAVDMTYTQLADVYLGDMSSQVYEFLRIPRPCVFLNVRGACWRDCESYRHWRFGPVVEDLSRLLHTIDEARTTHALFRPEQLRGLAETFDVSELSSSRRAAAEIAKLALRRAGSSRGRDLPAPAGRSRSER